MSRIRSENSRAIEEMAPVLLLASACGKMSRPEASCSSEVLHNNRAQCFISLCREVQGEEWRLAPDGVFSLIHRSTTLQTCWRWHCHEWKPSRGTPIWTNPLMPLMPCLNCGTKAYSLHFCSHPPSVLKHSRYRLLASWPSCRWCLVRETTPT